MIIELEGFMSHGSSTFTLPSTGLVVITGPNGAGKSALIEGVSIALWGRGTRSTRWQPWRGDQPGKVVLRDGDIIVERKWSGKSKSLKWRCGPAPNDVFDTTSKGQEALQTIVGSFDAWRRTCVFSSSDAAHFTMATDAERKDLLEELLGLGWFDVALAACRRDLHGVRTAIGQAERDRDLARAKGDTLASAIRQAQDLLKEVLDLGDVKLLKAELARIQEYLNETIAEIRSLDRDKAALLGAGGEHRAIAAELESKLKKVATDYCYTCGQLIPDSVRHKLRDGVKAAMAKADEAKASTVTQLNHINIALIELGEEESSLREIFSKKGSYVNQIISQKDLRMKLERSLKDQGAEMVRFAEALLDAQERLDKAAIDVAELEACEEVLGVRGARTILIGRTLSSIEALANTWMSRLGSDIRIQLKPYTEKKSGGTVDSISLGLIGAGGEAGYLGASAGERRRVDVALLMSLAELASGASAGARWRSPVFFDEVFDSLDVDGRDAVMEMVEGISKDRLVIMITHDEHVASAKADLRFRVEGGVIS